jgi:Chain length determinant protein
MSAATDTRERARDLDAEQDIDLGRLWRAVIARWWLVVIGLVAGAIIGLLVSLGGGKQWKATAELYLGQPLGPGTSGPISSVTTSLGLASYLATAEATIRDAAARSGLKPGQLRGQVSAKPILGLTGNKLGTAAPLLSITVTGSSRPKVARASNAVAEIIRKQFATYTDEKLATLARQKARDDTQLAQAQSRLNAAVAGQQRLLTTAGINQTDKLVALANFNLVISASTGQQTSLQNDQSLVAQEIAAAQNVEAPRVVTPGAAVSTGGPSRRSGVVIGAIIGLVLGLLAAVLWKPVAAQVRSRED